MRKFWCWLTWHRWVARFYIVREQGWPILSEPEIVCPRCKVLRKEL